MKCPKCGAENPEDSMFCQECGAKIDKQDNLLFQGDESTWSRKEWLIFIFGIIAALLIIVALVEM